MSENTATWPGPRCIICGQKGMQQFCDRVPIQPKGTTRKVKTRTATGGTQVLESGDLTIAYMIGPGSPPPSDFPGDPTGKKYFGAGASAYVQYHPECKGYTLEGYNAFLQTISTQMADDEDWVYANDKPASEGPWRGSPRPSGDPPRPSGDPPRPSGDPPRAVPIPDPPAPGVRP